VGGELGESEENEKKSFAPVHLHARILTAGFYGSGTGVIEPSEMLKVVPPPLSRVRT
jgi:hypothetical protein